METDVRKTIDEATEYARTCPDLESHEMYNQIYVGMDGVRIRGADAMTYGIHSPG